MGTNQVKDTDTHWWICPDCGCKNEMFMFTGDELPEVLECSFCKHISPKLEWNDA